MVDCRGPGDARCCVRWRPVAQSPLTITGTRGPVGRATSAGGDRIFDPARLRRLDAAGVVVLRVLVLVAAYYLAAKVGLLFEIVRGQVTPLWPPTGVALVGLFLLGVRAWPGITVGAFLVNAPLGPTLPAAGLISVGNTLAPLCGYLMLQRVGFRTQLDRPADVLALVFLGALTSALVSSSVGTGALVLAGAVPLPEAGATWSVWWAGDAMGVLVIAPVLLVAGSRWSRVLPLRRWTEAAALVLGTAAVTWWVATSSLSALFLVFPLLIWAALRFHQRGATVCVLIVCVLTTHAAATGVGGFGQRDLFGNMVILQAFNGCVALTALLLAALMHQRDLARRDVEQACAQLGELVGHIDTALRARRELDGRRVRNWSRWSAEP
jgi:integral membrane sensor domain MASE1